MFDSGNLARAVQVTPTTYHLYISEDCLPYATTGYYKTWFYFSVTGVPKSQTLTFSIRNMNNQGKLYKLGLKPVYRVLPDERKDWARITAEVGYEYGSEGFIVTWQHHFTYTDA